MPDDPEEHRPAEASRSARIASRIDAAKEWGLARAARYEDRPAVSTGMAIYQRDRASVGPVIGSAIAFRLFLFFVPTVLFLVGLAGLLSGHVSADDVTNTTGVSGGLADQIRSAFNQPERTRWVAIAIGLIGMVSAGRSLSKVLVSASTVAWRLPVVTRAPIRIVGALVGLFCAGGIVALIESRLRSAYGLGPASISFAAVLAIYAVLWLAISTLLPRATEDPGALLPGAIVVALGMTLMQAVSQFYLPDRFARASQLYGAIGLSVVTLAWFFILGRVIAVAMTLNAVLYERVGSVSTFVFSLPVLRIVARRSARLRRFFDLHHDSERQRETAGMASPGATNPELPDGVELRVLERRAVDEMVGKVRGAAAATGASDAIAAWRAAHGDEAWRDRGHDHAVVGETLMYLHDAPDGMLVPHARYPDGSEVIYTDAAHAGSAF